MKIIKDIGSYSIFIFLLLYASTVYASLSTVETYYQHGEKTTEYIVDKDDDLDYTFNKYYIRADQELTKKLAVMLNYIDYKRTYEQDESLDNRVRDYKNNWDYYFYKDKEGSLKLDVNLAYKTKRYDNKETLDFNRTKLSSQITWDKEKDWRIAIRGGADLYDFINNEANKKNLYYEKATVKKYLLDEKLTLIGDIKLKQTELNLKEYRNEYEVEAGADIKTDHNLLEKISLRGEIGEKNTVEDDEYEEEELNYDYKYTKGRIRTKHQLTDRLATSLIGEIKDKNYEEVNYDYKSYIAGNNWKWKYYLKSKRKKYIQIGLDLIHANTRYDTLDNLSHYKNGATIELAYKMWGRWSYALELGYAQYRYEQEERNRDTYSAGAVLSRGFFNNKLKLNLEYNYRIKDYLSSSRGNVYQNSFLIGGVYKF